MEIIKDVNKIIMKASYSAGKLVGNIVDEFKEKLKIDIKVDENRLEIIDKEKKELIYENKTKQKIKNNRICIMEQLF